MGKRLNDREKKIIISEYVETENYRETARRTGVSPGTVQRIVAGDPENTERIRKQRDANTREILAHMREKEEAVCTLMDLYLKAMMREDKIAGASVNQLSSTLCALIEKFTKHSESADGGSESFAEAVERAWKERGQ